MQTTLIHRTTRKLSLTETGRLSLERARRILEDGAAIEANILEEAAIPRGLVRIACTTGFGGKSLAQLLPVFMELYPGIEVDLCLTEDQVDIVADGFDVAIRIGQGSDSSLRTSRLFSFRRPLLAAPSFIERFGTPTHPNELPRFPAIIPTHVPWGSDWAFSKDGEQAIMVHMEGALKVNSVAAIVPALTAGTGLALMPEYFVWEEINDGSVVELLPDWSTSPGPVYLVTPPGRARPARVRVLLEFLRDHFANQPWAQGIER